MYIFQENPHIKLEFLAVNIPEFFFIQQNFDKKSLMTEK